MDGGGTQRDGDKLQGGVSVFSDCRWDKGLVLILDGYSEIGAHVRSNRCYLICLSHLFRSRAVLNRIFFLLFSFEGAKGAVAFPDIREKGGGRGKGGKE